MGRVPDQSYGLVTALGEEALQQQRDLPVPARDHYAHAASLVTGIIGVSATPPAGPNANPELAHMSAQVNRHL